MNRWWREDEREGEKTKTGKRSTTTITTSSHFVYFFRCCSVSFAASTLQSLYQGHHDSIFFYIIIISMRQHINELPSLIYLTFGLILLTLKWSSFLCSWLYCCWPIQQHSPVAGIHVSIVYTLSIYIFDVKRDKCDNKNGEHGLILYIHSFIFVYCHMSLARCTMMTYARCATLSLSVCFAVHPAQHSTRFPLKNWLRFRIGTLGHNRLTLMYIFWSSKMSKRLHYTLVGGHRKVKWLT